MSDGEFIHVPCAREPGKHLLDVVADRRTAKLNLRRLEREDRVRFGCPSEDVTNEALAAAVQVALELIILVGGRVVNRKRRHPND